MENKTKGAGDDYPVIPMSEDNAATDFLKDKGILKPGYSKWICRFEKDGSEFDINELMEEYAQKRYSHLEKELTSANELIKDLLRIAHEAKNSKNLSDEKSRQDFNKILSVIQRAEALLR